jgi:glycosyltransferase involved in cell wall biosynthesis
MLAILGPLDRRSTIVHLHGHTKALTTTPVLAASRAGFAVVSTLHDFFAGCPNGALYNYVQQALCPLRGLSMSCAMTSCDKRNRLHKAYRLLRGAAQRSIGRYPAVVRDYISLSQRSEDLMKQYLPADARFHPVSNIIDVAKARPIDVAHNQDLLVIGRLDVEKGVGLAAEAARRARLPIVFVGDGPERQVVEAAGARVTGWLSPDKVKDELERARCLVFPSVWYETFGLVVAEGAARGVPAIISDISAPAERVSHGIDSWVFRSGDIDDLAGQMAVTRSDATVCNAGIAVYQRYWARPSDPSRHVAELTAIYDEVIGRVAFL